MIEKIRTANAFDRKGTESFSHLWSTKEKAEGRFGIFWRQSQTDFQSGQKKKKKKKNETMEAVDAANTWIWQNMGQPSK